MVLDQAIDGCLRRLATNPSVTERSTAGFIGCRVLIPKRKDLDIGKAHVAMVALQGNVAGGKLGKVRPFGEFALGNALIPVVAADLVLAILDAVHPMFDMRAVAY